MMKEAFLGLRDFNDLWMFNTLILGSRGSDVQLRLEIEMFVGNGAQQLNH